MPERNIAPRKLLAFNVGGTTMVRSSNPKGYLIPDVGSFVLMGVEEGTVNPDATSIAIAEAGIVIRISADEEAAEQIFPALLSGSLRSGVMTLPSREHLTRWGLSGSYGLFGAVVEGEAPAGATQSPAPIVDLLEDASALAIAETHRPVQALDSAARPSHELSADATVAEIATRIAGVAGLSDGELARLFRVARETFQRWRTGDLTNPNPANRRRLGLLLRLLEDLCRRDVKVEQWLRNVSDIDSLTPYELLERGRLDDAEYLAAHLPTISAPHLAAGPDGMPVTRDASHPAFAPRRDEPVDDLTLDDDHEWIEVEAEAVEDDE